MVGEECNRHGDQREKLWGRSAIDMDMVTKVQRAISVTFKHYVQTSLNV